MNCKLKRYFFVLFLSAFLSLLFPQKAEAVFSFNIASSSATIITSGSQDVEVGLGILDLPSESYFRVSLQKTNGGSYYGYVLNNNGDWTKIQTLDGDCTAYYKVTDTTITSLLVKYRVGDDIEIPNGNYYLKAHRFTKSCTSYTEATNFLPFEVNFPTPTPTPTSIPTSTPTDIPQPTNTPTPTSIPPSSIPTVKSTPKPTVTPKPSITPKPILAGNTLSATSSAEEVLGTDSSKQPIDETKNDLEGESLQDVNANTKNNSGILPILFIAPGTLMIGFAIFMFIRSKHRVIQ